MRRVTQDLRSKLAWAPLDDSTYYADDGHDEGKDDPTGFVGTSRDSSSGEGGSEVHVFLEACGRRQGLAGRRPDAHAELVPDDPLAVDPELRPVDPGLRPEVVSRAS